MTTKKSTIFKSQDVFIKKYDLSRVFYFLVSLAVLSRIVCDHIYLNRIGIHLGELFPSRKFNPDSAPYSVYVLYLEWALAFTGALLLNFRMIRFGALLIMISYVMSLTQLFQNQKTLILIVVSALFLLPISRKNFWSIWFLRYQLIFIYFISAFQKIMTNFENGSALSTTFHYLYSIEKKTLIQKLIQLMSQQDYVQFFSWLTLAFEFLIPIIIIKSPKTGIALVLILHLSFNLLMKDIFPFTTIMIALSLLFLINKDSPDAEIN